MATETEAIADSAPGAPGAPDGNATSTEIADVSITAAPTPFTWLEPHVIFVVILVGEDETPFGIQKDYLCANSSFYRAYFAEKQAESAEQNKLEHIVKLPQATVEVFGFLQNFLYTRSLFTDILSLPGYEVLISLWKLGNELGIDGLCDAALDGMAEIRRVTQHIPATPLLVQAWKDAPEGSTIRKLLLNWAAEYIRSSESRQEFTKSLPQEVLSELVIAMSHLNSAPVIQVNPVMSPTTQTPRKNVHYLEADDSDAEPLHKPQKHRHSDVIISRPAQSEPKAKPKKSASRSSLPNPKPIKVKRSSLSHADEKQYPTDKKLLFCADLLGRMLSGPGFWTRLVGPFREPVKPVEDGVPDYLDKVKKPMDLATIKAKLDHHEYTSEQEFAADMRQIFENCYTYHQPGSVMYQNCERLQKTFEEKFGDMLKWVSKLDGDEGA
ncbi:putative Bromodomain testis-specific protein [Hypomontagnella monticulosa]|nr:putative Bromodomain testis-specific protein [Hypomontagnella monticulosa]